MSISPVGIYNIFEPSRAFSDALDLVFMYQPKPDAYCADAFSAGVVESFNTDTSSSIIGKTIQQYALDESFINFNFSIFYFYFFHKNLNIKFYLLYIAIAFFTSLSLMDKILSSNFF